MLDKLMIEADDNGVEVREHAFRSLRLKGLYCDGVITLNTAAIRNNAEKTCILAEEMGHYETTAGDILNQKEIQNRKKEMLARSWAYNRLVPLSKIIEVYTAQIRGRYEIAEYLNVTEEFLEQSIKRYQEKYGICTQYNDRYVIYFDPLGVMEIY